MDVELAILRLVTALVRLAATVLAHPKTLGTRKKKSHRR